MFRASLAHSDSCGVHSSAARTPQLTLWASSRVKALAAGVLLTGLGVRLRDLLACLLAHSDSCGVRSQLERTPQLSLWARSEDGRACGL